MAAAHAALPFLPLLGSGRHGIPLSLLGWIGLGLFSLVALALTGVAGTTLWWMLHAWANPERFTSTGFGGRSGALAGVSTGPGAMAAADRPGVGTRSYSLIVPARHEEQVLGHTLDGLAALHHPSIEVLAVVGHDDPRTRQVAEEAARRHPDRVRVLVDDNWPKNKPKALNTALAHCTGDVTGVFDAEDEVHPDLLAHVDDCFDTTGADVVQGGVQLVNHRSSWWALHNVMEYYFWFRSRLHFHADRQFIPLGGNTVFVRTDLLQRAGGWDPECLAEDCELGVRLSSQGSQVAVAYEPHLVTREETPPTFRALVKQRTRWDQGFLQVLHKGIWRRLPSRRRRLLARYTLSMPFLQAFTGVLVPLSVAAVILLRLPVVFVLLSFLPLAVTIITVAVQAVGLHDFCHAYGLRAGPVDYARLVLGTPFYQVMLAFAAVRAVTRELRGQRGWEKTAHVGAHRPAASLAGAGGAR